MSKKGNAITPKSQSLWVYLYFWVLFNLRAFAGAMISVIQMVKR